MSIANPAEVTSPLPSATTVASARMPGLDVARAVAVLGMVLVNYQARLHAYETELKWLTWAIDCITGKAAAVFIVLAGLGVTMRSRSALQSGGVRLLRERQSLLKRSAVLFGLGLLNLHVWNWDILHCYGVYLALGVMLLRVHSRWLWTLAAVLVASETVMLVAFDYEQRPSFWSLSGGILDIFFNGVHPVAPWMALFLAGMWLGRQELREPRVRKRIVLWSLLVLSCAETMDSLALHHPEWIGLDAQTAWWFRTWPRPPRPLFPVACISFAMFAICISISLTQNRSRNRVVLALTATGQMAFTLYLAHIVAVLIPISHGLLTDSPLEIVVVYALAFYSCSIALSVWWRNRWPYGPFEGLLRQVTGSAAPSMWGGQVLDPAKAEMNASDISRSSGFIPPSA